MYLLQASDGWIIEHCRHHSTNSYLKIILLKSNYLLFYLWREEKEVKICTRSSKNMLHLEITSDMISLSDMICSKNGFIALCKKDKSYPQFNSYHCVIHQEVLWGKTFPFQHVIDPVTKILNSVWAAPLQHCTFKEAIQGPLGANLIQPCTVNIWMCWVLLFQSVFSSSKALNLWWCFF